MTSPNPDTPSLRLSFFLDYKSKVEDFIRELRVKALKLSVLSVTKTTCFDHKHFPFVNYRNIFTQKRRRYTFPFRHFLLLCVHRYSLSKFSFIYGIPWVWSTLSLSNLPNLPNLFPLDVPGPSRETSFRNSSLVTGSGEIVSRRGG